MPSHLEASGAPIDELDGTFGLDGSNGGVDVLGYDITTVQHATGHVFTVTRIAFHHLVGRFEASVGDLSHSQLLVVSLFGRNDRGVGDQREVDAGIGHQIRLELGQIHVESAVETQRGRDGRHNLTNQTVQVGVRGAFNVQVATADVVDGFVVDHESAVRVLQSSMGSQNRVVGFNNGSGDLGGRVDGEFQFGFLSVIDRQTLHQQRSESGSGTSTKRVKDEESLKSGALVGELAHSVEDQVDDLLADGVVTSSVVVGGIFLAGDQLFGMEKLLVGTGTDFIDDGGFQVDKDGTRDVLAGTGFGEEGVERVITTSNRFVRWHLTIRLDSMLQAVQFPAGVTDLDTSLTDVDRDTFTL